MSMEKINNIAVSWMEGYYGDEDLQDDNISKLAFSAMKEICELSKDGIWTPCSVALPENTGSFKVTVQVGSEMGTWREEMIIPFRICDGIGEWFLPKSDWKSYGVIAWAETDEPYRGEA